MALFMLTLRSNENTSKNCAMGVGGPWSAVNVSGESAFSTQLTAILKMIILRPPSVPA
jgi:hypothetical protein